MLCHRIRVSFFALALLPTAAAAEQWLEIRLGGLPAGYVRQETTSGDPIVTTAELRMVLNRLGSKVEIRASTREEEQSDRLVAIRAEITSSAQSTTMSGRIEGSALALSISTGGKSYQRRVALDEPLLGPEGVRQLTLARLRSPGDKLSYKVFSAELGVVTTMTRSLLERESDGLRIEESTAGLPGAATLWLDQTGRLRRRVQPGPFGEIEIRASTRDKAMAATTGADLPPEAYKSSLVRSNIRLPNERGIERLRVRITHKKPELGWPDFSDDRQTVVAQSGASVTLEIRRRSERRQPAPEAAFQTPNALFQSDDPAVVEIARKVGGPQPDIFALRNWTTSHVRFDAGIAMAPASEVVRNRAGTCFGYAILLGALARAAGMPSRLKMGFVYTSGIWGGHAWIEVYKNGEWIPVDAALPSAGRADAARISFFSSPLEEGTIAGVGSLARMYGNVSIEILGYTNRGNSVEVPSGARPFSVAGNVYQNVFLGIRVMKPAGYRYAGLDAIWPEPGIVQLHGPGGEIVMLDITGSNPDAYLERRGIRGSRQNVRTGKHCGFMIDCDSKAAFVIPARGDHWVLIAEAPAAADLLRRSLQWLHLKRTPARGSD